MVGNTTPDSVASQGTNIALIVVWKLGEKRERREVGFVCTAQEAVQRKRILPKKDAEIISLSERCLVTSYL